MASEDAVRDTSYITEKNLQVLLDALRVQGIGCELSGLAPASVAVGGLAFDSRSVRRGDLFFALPGTHTSGNSYIRDALKAGAAAVVYEGDYRPSADDLGKETFVKVPSARFAMSPVSAAFYDNPSQKLGEIGRAYV